MTKEELLHFAKESLPIYFQNNGLLRDRGTEGAFEFLLLEHEEEFKKTHSNDLK